MKLSPTTTASGTTSPAPGMRATLRSLLRPEQRWHYVFHVLVMAVASAYWVVSVWATRGGLRTLSETILYRPDGDSQLWPLITSLSQFNFGDPTDFIEHGQGITSFPIVSILPYALLCSVFGQHGYLIGDVLLQLLYFLSVCLFLRVSGMGHFTSLWVGLGLATGVLQAMAAGLAAAFSVVIDPFGLVAMENFFPNLLELTIHSGRIHRPMVTEIWLVLLMTALLRLWRGERPVSFGFGVGLGALMGLMLQGDFYSLAGLGLAFLVWLIREMARQRWRPTWLLGVGMLVGTAAVSWYFVYQRVMEHPDFPRRVGVTEYGHGTILFLPGYAGIVRAAVVSLAAGWLLFLMSRAKASVPEERSDAPVAPARAVAVFFPVLMIAAYFAQPVQIFIFGRSAQIYHFLHALPVFYSYAVIVLGYHLIRRHCPAALVEGWRHFGERPGRVGAGYLAIVFAVGMMLALQKPIARIYHQETVRGASVEYEPWTFFGKDYRPALTKLERGLIRDPMFKRVRTIATLNLDVYVLFTAFHGKLAFNPDASTTVIGDSSIEDRLCVLARIFDLDIEKFGQFIQQENVKNYFLGSNKYRFASDHRFSADLNDYTPELIAQYMKDKHYHQWGWILAIPRSELQRLTMRYLDLRARQPNVGLYPDLIILDRKEVAAGYVPSTNFYRLMGTNTVFQVFGKLSLSQPVSQ